MFSNRDLRKLMIPLILEQLLTSLVGIADTMMVAGVGSAAVSGVSLVDAINKVFLFVFTALATGGTIVCSQFLGRQDHRNADRAAGQVVMTSFALSVAMMLVCLLLRKPMLHGIFGTVEADVMTSAEIYFYVTALSYPFLAVFYAGAALFRAAGNSRLPMLISLGANLLNVAGNALLMYVLKMGVLGAAISTTVSFAIAAVYTMVRLCQPGQEMRITAASLTPSWSMIWLVLSIGIPTGVENAAFQVGKLMVQSTVSTLGTTAIAAHAMLIMLEGFTSTPGTAIGTGLMTVAGQCMGAGRVDEAKYYIKKLTIWSTVLLFAFNWAMFLVLRPVLGIAGLEPGATALTYSIMLVISIAKPFTWPMAFLPANGMRAAGDVRFCMVVSIISMFVMRVGLSTLLCRVMHVGLIGIWIGWIVDWGCRSIVFTIRYLGGKWTTKTVVDRAKAV